MKKLINNNRGATSVLIMVMMIILMIFGLAALTTSVASKKLAEKNNNWLKEYYVLQGHANIGYAYLIDSLSLPEQGMDLNKIENALLDFVKNNVNISFQKTEEAERPFLIEMTVAEKRSNVNKSIIMQFSIVKGENNYRLQIDKWLERQPENFELEEEFEFSDINVIE